MALERELDEERDHNEVEKDDVDLLVDKDILLPDFCCSSNFKSDNDGDYFKSKDLLLVDVQSVVEGEGTSTECLEVNIIEEDIEKDERLRNTTVGEHSSCIGGDTDEGNGGFSGVEGDRNMDGVTLEIFIDEEIEVERCLEESAEEDGYFLKDEEKCFEIADVQKCEVWEEDRCEKEKEEKEEIHQILMELHQETPMDASQNIEGLDKENSACSDIDVSHGSDAKGDLIEVCTDTGDNNEETSFLFCIDDQRGGGISGNDECWGISQSVSTFQEDRMTPNYHDNDVISLSASGQVVDFALDASALVTDVVRTPYVAGRAQDEIIDGRTDFNGALGDATECCVLTEVKETLSKQQQSDVTSNQDCVHRVHTSDNYSSRAAKVSSHWCESVRGESPNCQSPSFLTNRDRSFFLAELLQTSCSPEETKAIKPNEFIPNLEDSRKAVLSEIVSYDVFDEEGQSVEDGGDGDTVAQWIKSVIDKKQCSGNQSTETSFDNSSFPLLSGSSSSQEEEESCLLPLESESEQEEVCLPFVTKADHRHSIEERGAEEVIDGQDNVVSSQGGNGSLADLVPLINEGQESVHLSVKDDGDFDSEILVNHPEGGLSTVYLEQAQVIPFSSFTEETSEGGDNDDSSSLSFSDEDELVASIITVIAADQYECLRTEVEDGDVDCVLPVSESENTIESVQLSVDNQIKDFFSIEVEDSVLDPAVRVAKYLSDNTPCEWEDQVSSYVLCQSDCQFPGVKDHIVSRAPVIEEDDLDPGSCLTETESSCVLEEHHSECLTRVSEDLTHSFSSPSVISKANCIESILSVPEEQVDSVSTLIGKCDVGSVSSLTESQIDERGPVIESDGDGITSLDENKVEFITSSAGEKVKSIFPVGGDKVDLISHEVEGLVNDATSVIEYQSNCISPVIEDHVDCIPPATECKVPCIPPVIEDQIDCVPSAIEDQVDHIPPVIEDREDSIPSVIKDQVYCISNVIDDQDKCISCVNEDQINWILPVIEDQGETNPLVIQEPVDNISFIAEKENQIICIDPLLGNNEVSDTFPPLEGNKDNCASIGTEIDEVDSSISATVEKNVVVNYAALGNDIDQVHHPSFVSENRVDCNPSLLEEEEDQDDSVDCESEINSSPLIVSRINLLIDSVGLANEEIITEFAQHLTGIESEEASSSVSVTHECGDKLVDFVPPAIEEDCRGCFVPSSVKSEDSEGDSTKFVGKVNEGEDSLAIFGKDFEGEVGPKEVSSNFRSEEKKYTREYFCREEGEEGEISTSFSTLREEVDGIDFIAGVIGVVKDGWHSLPTSAVEGNLPFDSFLSVIEEEDQIDSIPPVIGIDRDQTDSSPRVVEVDAELHVPSIPLQGKEEEGVEEEVEESVSVLLTPPAPGECEGCVELQIARDESKSRTDEEILVLGNEEEEIIISDVSDEVQYSEGIRNNVSEEAEENSCVEREGEEAVLEFSSTNGNDPDEVSDFNDTKVGENDVSKVGVTSAAVDSLDITKEELGSVASLGELQGRQSVREEIYISYQELRDETHIKKIEGDSTAVCSLPKDECVKCEIVERVGVGMKRDDERGLDSVKKEVQENSFSSSSSSPASSFPGESPSSSELCSGIGQGAASGQSTKGEMSESSNRDSGTSYLSEVEESDDTLVARSSDGDGVIRSSSSSEEGNANTSNNNNNNSGNSDVGGGVNFNKGHRRDDSGVVMGSYPGESHQGLKRQDPLNPPPPQSHHVMEEEEEKQLHQHHNNQENHNRDQSVSNELIHDHGINVHKRNIEDDWSEAEDNSGTLERGMSLSTDLEKEDEDGNPFSRFRRSRSHQFRMARRFSGAKMVKKMKKAVHFGKKSLSDDNGNHPHHTKVQDTMEEESFGKRSGGGGRRANECLILEPSEMIVIDYPDVQLMRPGQRASCNTMNLEKLMALEQDEITIRPGGRGAPPPPPSHPHAVHPYENEQIHHHHPHHHDPYLPDLVGSAILRGARSRGSVGSSVRDGSDTSSAYSGSDTMCHSLHSSLEPDDVDLSGLTESAVDSDEEDLAESIESLAVRDCVRECLEKDPSERTEDDIEVLLEFTQRLQAFSNMTLAVRRAMCQAMVFAVVEDAGTTLMNHGEELDSWSVIINGHVEVTQPDGNVHELHLGDSFGITPTMEKLYHQGVMRSKVDDCQFVCIRQTDYYRILHQGEENTRRVEEDGIVVLVTEQRPIDGGNRKGNIVIKGTSEKLMCQLVEVENNVDPTYVEDFLLTHRTFVETPLTVSNKLLQWFEDPSLRDRVTRVVLLWVNNHFTDFEMDLVMMNFLEQFEEGLEREKMAGQLRLLDFACATKARARVVTLTRPSRDEILHFSILGGYERGHGIFISKVEKGSKAEEVGLKRGDQILEVNGQSFDHMNHGKALEILRQPCHLSITVKSNLLAFKEMLSTPDNSPRPHARKTSDVRGLSEGNGHLPMNNFAATVNMPSDHTQQSPRDKGKEDKNKASFMTIGASTAKQFKKKIINSFVPKPAAPESQMNSDESVSSQSSVGGGLYHSHSNPDLSTAGTYEDVRTEFPEHVLKVYRATDHNARFLPVHKETTAREVVMLALQLFNINDPTGSSNYALYEVTVTEEGITKQKRLPDSLQNLAERIGLSSRYYLKNITVSQTLVPDDIVTELVRESAVYFLQLNSVELAIQLTLEDYTIFRQIEPTEYIDYLFNLKSNYGTPALSQFAGLVNREMFWVVTEVCSEHNLVKRSKIIKQFIKVARQCKECKNFNSMFAILSGLGHGAVSRLKQTWERLPSKYSRMFHDMQDLMDPSRNMSKYRNLVQNENIQSPIIPFYPVVARDLTFTHEGNDDKVEGLINFEKLRMISRYIRDLQNMCSAPYDLFNIQDAGGQPPSSALISLNQMAAGGHQIATVKRRKKSTAAPDKKKMYEEAQMVRRVKAYLSRLQVVTDEELLRTMSVECEGGPEGHKTGASSTTGQHHNSNNNSGSSSAPPTNPPPRRRPHSPTPSTTSSTSSTSQTSDGKKHATAKFGATSPQSISKMKALAEPKTKPHHGPRSNNTHHSLSPSPSPGPPRKGAMTNHNPRSNHERSHSDTHAVPVDLSAESSSVTSLSKLHKSHTSGSVTSNECQVGPGESDSGISTHFDCHSSSSLEVGGVTSHEWQYHSSPPAHHRRYSHQPESRSRPPFPHAIPVLPPVPTTGVCSNRVRRGAPGVPPDYVATQLRMKQMGRALSHDGVQYYHHSHSHHDDEEEDAQVSAV